MVIVSWVRTIRSYRTVSTMTDVSDSRRRGVGWFGLYLYWIRPNGNLNDGYYVGRFKSGLIEWSSYYCCRNAIYQEMSRGRRTLFTLDCVVYKHVTLRNLYNNETEIKSFRLKISCFSAVKINHFCARNNSKFFSCKWFIFP